MIGLLVLSLPVVMVGEGVTRLYRAAVGRRVVPTIDDLTRGRR